MSRFVELAVSAEANTCRAKGIKLAHCMLVYIWQVSVAVEPPGCAWAGITRGARLDAGADAQNVPDRHASSTAANPSVPL